MGSVALEMEHQAVTITVWKKMKRRQRKGDGETMWYCCQWLLRLNRLFTLICPPWATLCFQLALIWLLCLLAQPFCEMTSITCSRTCCPTDKHSFCARSFCLPSPLLRLGMHKAASCFRLCLHADLTRDYQVLYVVCNYTTAYLSHCPCSRVLVMSLDMYEQDESIWVASQS